MPSLIEQNMPVLAKVKGRWQGTYTEEDLTGTVLDHHRFFLDISFPDAPGANYRQQTIYDWDDGRHVELLFDAGLERREGRWVIAWDHPLMHGFMTEVDDRTLHLRFSYKGSERIDVQESMFIDADGQHRLRTWHWFADDRPWKITRVIERRC